MRYARVKRKNAPNRGKQFFLITAAVIGVYIALSNFLAGPDVQSCDTQSLAYCGCPKDQSQISKRHLLLIDVTDQPPAGKKEDLSQLLRTFGSEHKGLSEWLSSGRRSELMTVFVIGSVTPSDSLATASFCKAPPKVSLFIQGQKREKRHLEDVEKIVSRVLRETYAAQGNTQSKIVESISTLTSSSSAWAEGSALILASDLRENSAQCGFFETTQVTKPALSGSLCMEYFKNIRANMYSISSKGETPSRAFICRFDSKEPKIGLNAYWDDVFLDATGFKPIRTCSYSDIQKIHHGSAGR